MVKPCKVVPEGRSPEAAGGNGQTGIGGEIMEACQKSAFAELRRYK